jgi:hypothetical protein
LDLVLFGKVFPIDPYRKVFRVWGSSRMISWPDALAGFFVAHANFASASSGKDS